jgi:hypothetical protein
MDVTLHSPLAWALWALGMLILLAESAAAALVLARRRRL